MALPGRIPFCMFLLAVVFAVGVIVFAITSLFLFNEPSTSDKGPRAVDTLKLVVVVVRHGNRRLYTIPNDPYPFNDTRYWHFGLGELTTVGRVQMYKLGAKIRSLYNGFLNSTYYSQDFHASSTKLDRSMMSGSLFLAGLYPPRGFQRWSDSLDWQPIPLPSDSPDKSVVMTETVCPRFKEDQTKSLTQFMADKNNSAMIVSIMDYLNIGLNDTNSMPFIWAWDTFTSEETEGFALPAWVKKVYPEPMRTVVSRLAVAYFSATDLMARLYMGSLYREIVQTLMSKMNGTLTPDRKMFFYSGHDVTLLTLQYILGMPMDAYRVVTPGSALVYELHQNVTSRQFYLQVLYINGASENLEPFALDIPDCPSPCDINYVINKTEKFYNITDYNAECQLNFTSNI